MLTSAQFCLFHLCQFSSIWLKYSNYSLYTVYYIWQTGMYGFCVVHNEFHGRYYSVLPGLNKVILATLYVLWCYWNNVICYYSSFIVLFGVQTSLFWRCYLYCDVVKKALCVTYFNIVYYDVIKLGLYLL